MSAAIAITCHSGTITDIPTVWHGIALAVHAPHNEAEAKATGARWIVTHIPTGFRAGATTNRARAIKAAKAWDGVFAASADAFPDNARQWPHGDAWVAQLSGKEPINAPAVMAPAVTVAEPKAPPRDPVTFADGDGGDQLPVTPTMQPVIVNGVKKVRLSSTLPNGRRRIRDDQGRPVKQTGDVASFKRNGDPAGPPILRLWFRDRWHDVPSMAEFGVWTFDSCCETPDGRIVEPDDSDSWLSLCGLV